MNSKLHVLTDATGRPISLYLSASQTSDYFRAAALLSTLHGTGVLLADRAMTRTGSATH